MVEKTDVYVFLYVNVKDTTGKNYGRGWGGGIVVKWIIKKYGERAWTGFDLR